MKRVLSILLGIAATSALGVSGASAQVPTEDSVTGISAPPSGGYEFDAHSGPSGENPTGTVDALLGPNSRISATVKCLAVTGTRATVGVDILDLGAFVHFYVEDNGGPGTDRYALGGPAVVDCSAPAPPDLFWQTAAGDIEIVDAQSLPISKDQCKNGGWRNYPDFKNQGQCVAFVQRGPTG